MCRLNDYTTQYLQKRATTRNLLFIRSFFFAFLDVKANEDAGMMKSIDAMTILNANNVPARYTADMLFEAVSAYLP